MRARRLGSAATGRILLAAAFGVLPAAGHAQNLATNPDFHDHVLDWFTAPPGNPPVWTDLTDEGNCAGSGAAVMACESVGDHCVAAVYQCIPIQQRELVYAAVRFNSPPGVGIEVRFDFYSASNCLSGHVGSALGFAPTSGVFWSDASLMATRPGSAQAVKVEFLSRGLDQFDLLVDGVFVGHDDNVFRDGFDGNLGGESAPCRWSIP